MRRFFAFYAAAFFAATPAYALKVTNLDHVPHTVELAGRGTPETRIIPPGATEHFVGASQGFLSLKSAQKIKKSHSRVHADGLLSGIIGNERNQGIPADPLDNFVIWPEGKLMIQSRTKPAGRW